MAPILAMQAKAQTINTNPADPYDPSSGAGSFGNTFWGQNHFSAAQSFTLDATFTTLESFGFYIRAGDAGFAKAQYSALVATWDPSRLDGSGIGPILWQSAATAGFDSYTPVLVTFSPRGLALQPGQTYMAILSMAGYYVYDDDVPHSTGVVSGAGGDTYSGGNGYFRQHGDGGTEQLTGPNSRWRDYGYDFAFQATLSAGASAVPEPSMLVLTLTGGVAVAAILRRMRRVT